MSISATYASPGLRVGLLMEDHPDAVITYRVGTAAECGVPDEWGGAQEVVICRIERGGTHPAIEAYKADLLTDVVKGKRVTREPDPERWAALCTKALGRALKRCGYPDDMTDLRALVLWRQRNAEVAVIGAAPAPTGELGSAPAALESPEDAATFDAAGRAEPDETGGDDATDDDVAELVNDDPATEDELAEVREVLAGLAPSQTTAVSAWARSRGFSAGKPDTGGQVTDLLNFVSELLHEAGAD